MCSDSNGRIPTLDELAQDPSKATILSTEERSSLLVRCAAVLIALSAPMLVPMGAQAVPTESREGPERDRLLWVQEAARRLGVTPAWLYRRHRSLPFARKLSHKVLRVSEAALNRWLATRKA